APTVATKASRGGWNQPGGRGRGGGGFRLSRRNGCRRSRRSSTRNMGTSPFIERTSAEKRRLSAPPNSKHFCLGPVKPFVQLAPSPGRLLIPDGIRTSRTQAMAKRDPRENSGGGEQGRPVLRALRTAG